MVIRILSIIIGYIFGLFQTSYIIGKINHMDIRDYGSGNAGTTNTMRVLGKKAGIITFLGDALKAVIAILVVRFLIARPSYSDIELVLVLYAGLGVILGHNFPFYMGFKGGKGIAATAGLIAGIGNPIIIVLEIIIFVFVTFISKYVSLGSLFVVSGLLIELIIFGQSGLVKGITPDNCVETYCITAFIALLAFIRHRQNIIRIMNHTERKIGEKKENI